MTTTRQIINKDEEFYKQEIEDFQKEKAQWNQKIKGFDVETAYVTIMGIRPLRMSSPKEMFLKENERKAFSIKKITKDSTIEEEAERSTYRDQDKGFSGNLCVPAPVLRRVFVEATKQFDANEGIAAKRKRGGMKLMNQFRGSVSIYPDNVLIRHPGTGKLVEIYRIDSAKVTNAATKGSLITRKPVIDEWFLKFEIRWMPELYGLQESFIKQVVERAGYIGIMDYRPDYGLFRLVDWRVD